MVYAKGGPVHTWVDGMYRIVDQNVAGIKGQTTKDNADQVVQAISRGVPGVAGPDERATLCIMAMTRTVTQDVQRQIRNNSGMQIAKR